MSRKSGNRFSEKDMRKLKNLTRGPKVEAGFDGYPLSVPDFQYR